MWKRKLYPSFLLRQHWFKATVDKRCTNSRLATCTHTQTKNLGNYQFVQLQVFYKEQNGKKVNYDPQESPGNPVGIRSIIWLTLSIKITKTHNNILEIKLQNLRKTFYFYFQICKQILKQYEQGIFNHHLIPSYQYICINNQMQFY